MPVDFSFPILSRQIDLISTICLEHYTLDRHFTFLIFFHVSQFITLEVGELEIYEF
jgi:hypothetical protein